MQPYITTGHIHSLDGETKEITVLQQLDNVNYIVEYNGVKCSAIFNWYTCSFYVDDKYGIIKEDNN